MPDGGRPARQLVKSPRLFALDQTQTTSDDMYTPPWLFDAMNITFDLDVAAPPGGVPWVPARRHYDQAADGLTASWEGRVWMNPPFSNTGQWARRFIDHRHGVALMPVAKAAYTEQIWDTADGITLKNTTTVRFVLPDEVTGGDRRYKQIFMSCWLVAYGADCVDAISRVGTVRRTG